LRFFNRIGATEVDPDTVCNKAGHVALQLTYGESTRGFDPRTIDGTNCVMIWGANPSTSAPHVHQYWLSETPAPKIVIDPIRHETAAAADMHLQLYPGTDGALAFAMLHAISAAGRIDRAFLATRSKGWEEIAGQLAACTPAWGEATTGVPARLIEDAALLYAAGPSLLWMGQGFQRQTFGGNAMRAVALLPAATGNLGRYGAGFLYLNGWDTRGVDAGYLTATHLKPKSAQTISHMDLASRLEAPETEAIVTWNNNIAASSPEQRRLRRALERDDLLQVTLDLFQTDTANYADYVLPAASFLEFDDVVMSYFNASISAQVKAVPPLGESLPNQEIFRRLAAVMGLTDPELFEPDAEMIATLLDQAKPGLTFEALAEAGTIEYPPEPGVQFEHHDYRTPSGKIELTGSAFVDAGLPRTLRLGRGATRPRRAAPALPGIEMADEQQLRQRPQDPEATWRGSGDRASRRSAGARNRQWGTRKDWQPYGRAHAAALRFCRGAAGRHPRLQEPLDRERRQRQCQRAQSRQ
jgi:anaerobic selenocysteine-containing dehydrogenase